jgi:hypothetical protein
MVVGLFVGLRATMVLLSRFGARVLGVCGFLVGALGFLLGTRIEVDSGYALTAAWTLSSEPASAERCSAARTARWRRCLASGRRPVPP